MPVRRLLLISAVAAAFLVAPASAQAPGVTVTLSPNTAGRSSTLVLSADGQADQVNGRIPRSAVISVQRGFRVDPRARAARCTSSQASSFSCPAASRIGTGQAIVTASGAFVPGGSQDFTASIELFLGAAAQRGDVAGVVVVVREPTTGQRGTGTGRIVRLASGPYGYELRFDRIPAQTPPPGVTIRLKRLDLRAGARRTVTVRRTVRRGGRRRTVRRRVTYSLITNPTSCDGSWNGHAAVGFTDGSSLEGDVTSPCTPR